MANPQAKVRRPNALKHVVRDAHRTYRRLTAKLRTTPDFVILGGQRCGTTSLYKYLLMHPFTAPPVRKEVHFFDIQFGRGLGWYRSHFPTALAKKLFRRRRGHELLVGEASPYYLFHPHAPRRLADTLPQARLLAILRNPVDRAYSHYHHEVRLGAETLPSFEAAVDAEEERLRGERERLLADETAHSHAHQHFSYLSRGRYAEQLEGWLRAVSRDRMLVLRSEDLYADPRSVVARAAAFLGLPAFPAGHLRPYNQGSAPDLDPALRRRLADHFAPHNRRLTELLGRDFGWDP